MNIHNSLGKHKIIMERCQLHLMHSMKTKEAKLDVKRLN